MARFIEEGTWSGYHAGQMRVVHRRVITKQAAETLKDARGILFTDGTMLYLNVRQALPREKVKVRNQYGSLIDECRRKGYWKVEGLQDAPWLEPIAWRKARIKQAAMEVKNSLDNF